MTSRIVDVVHYSPRVARLRLEAKSSSISIVQVYAPTADADEEDHATFYEDIQNALHGDRSLFKVVQGDFNSTIGCRTSPSETFVGPHSNDTRNSCGDRLASFIESEHLYHANSFFRKNLNDRWTHASPNDSSRREIDFVLTNRLNSIWNIEHLHHLHTGSDHRAIRATLVIDNAFVRKSKIARQLGPSLQLNRATLALDPRIATLLPSSMVDISEEYDDFVTHLKAITSAHRQPSPSHSNDRISQATKLLLAQRSILRDTPNRDPVAFASLSKECRRRIKDDHNQYRTSRLLLAAELRKSLKTTSRRLAEHQLLIPSIKNPDGVRITSHRGIEEEFVKFYSNLYSSSWQGPNFALQQPQDAEAVPFVLPSEVRSAIESSASGKASGPDKISIDEIKSMGHEPHTALAERFSVYLAAGSIPTAWKTSSMSLIFKKGDKEDIGNYRPITSLPVMYKIFSKIILARVRKTLDSEQPLEQTGFRPGFSTMDNIQTVTRVIEACREHKIDLVLTFVDYKKAFDSVEVVPILRALENQGVHHQYLKILGECLSGTSTTIRLYDRKLTIPINRGARQGDPISPTIFSAVLEHALRNLNWQKHDLDTNPLRQLRGIRINGRQLHHLRFADDIVIFSKSLAEASSSLNELDTVGRAVGLEINLKKTQYMSNFVPSNAELRVGQSNIERVDRYTFLGRSINMSNDLTHELSRRRSAGWAALYNIMPVISTSSDSNLKRSLFNTHVLPAITYGSATWALTAASENHLRVTQAALERKMVGIPLRVQRDRHLHNSDIRAMTGVNDIIVQANSNKHRWAGHLMRRQDDRWSTSTATWYPRDVRRPVGRPPMRWSDSLAHRNNSFKLFLNRHSGTVRAGLLHWSSLAQDRLKWKANWVPQKSNRSLRHGTTK